MLKSKRAPGSRGHGKRHAAHEAFGLLTHAALPMYFEMVDRELNGIRSDFGKELQRLQPSMNSADELGTQGSSLHRAFQPAANVFGGVLAIGRHSAGAFLLALVRVIGPRHLQRTIAASGEFSPRSHVEARGQGGGLRVRALPAFLAIIKFGDHLCDMLRVTGLTDHNCLAVGEKAGPWI